MADYMIDYFELPTTSTAKSRDFFRQGFRVELRRLWRRL